MLGAYVTRSILQRSEEGTSLNELMNYSIFSSSCQGKKLSKFDLLKCCGIFHQQSGRLRTLQGAVQVSKKQFNRLPTDICLLDRATVNLIKFYKQLSVQKRGFASYDERLKCVENSHFSTIDHCTVKLSPAVKLIQYHL